jgi:hypothetical protein
MAEFDYSGEHGYQNGAEAVDKFEGFFKCTWLTRFFSCSRTIWAVES